MWVVTNRIDLLYDLAALGTALICLLLVQLNVLVFFWICKTWVDFTTVGTALTCLLLALTFVVFMIWKKLVAIRCSQPQPVLIQSAQTLDEYEHNDVQITQNVNHVVFQSDIGGSCCFSIGAKGTSEQIMSVEDVGMAGASK